MSQENVDVVLLAVAALNERDAAALGCLFALLLTPCP